MKNIRIYTTTYCPYCVRAKALLDRKKAIYEEINIQTDENLRNEMLAASNGAKTVPQIFIGDEHVGGCDNLYALEASGKLDKLLI